MEHSNMPAGGQPQLTYPNPLQGSEQERSSHLPPVLIQYWQIALRRRWLMLGIIVACFAIGGILTLLTAPKYTAKVTIEISRQQKQITNIESVEDERSGDNVEFYATQYALLKTRPLAERVASELRLADEAAFFEAHGLDDATLEERTPGKTDAALRERRRNTVVDLLLRNIRISPLRASRLVEISYTSRSAKLSTQIANKWASAFIALSMDRQFASTADARKFLETRLTSLRQKLEDSERKVVLYGARERIVSLDQVRDDAGRTVANRTMASTDLEQLNTALNQAVAARIEAEARAREGGENSSQAVVSLTLGNLRQQRATLAAQRARLLVQFEESYPSVQEIQRQMQAVDQAIGREVSRIDGARQQEYRELQTREDELRSRVDGLKRQLDTQNRAGIQYAIYQRDADTNRQLYDALLQRYKEIGVAGTIGVNNILIVEPAMLPDKPSSPRLTVNLAIALLLGIILASATAFALEQIDEGIREPGEVEAVLKLPMLGITPLTENNSIADLKDTKSHLFDAYFSIRSNLAFATSQGFPRSLAVISTRPNEGKSLTALALAGILGRTNKRVLLIDADLRSPSVHTMVDIENGAGFSNVLAGEDDWKALLHETSFRNVSVLTAGPMPPSAAELLSGERLGEFIEHALVEFDYVIVDSPPVLGMTDAPLIAKAVSGVVYVVQSAGAAVRGVRASIDRLHMVNAHIFGVVLTKVGSRSGYGYGDGYGYGYGQRYGKDTGDS